MTRRKAAAKRRQPDDGEIRRRDRWRWQVVHSAQDRNTTMISYPNNVRYVYAQVVGRPDRPGSMTRRLSLCATEIFISVFFFYFFLSVFAPLSFPVRRACNFRISFPQRSFSPRHIRIREDVKRIYHTIIYSYIVYMYQPTRAPTVSGGFFFVFFFFYFGRTNGSHQLTRLFFGARVWAKKWKKKKKRVINRQYNRHGDVCGNLRRRASYYTRYFIIVFIVIPSPLLLLLSCVSFAFHGRKIRAPIRDGYDRKSDLGAREIDSKNRFVSVPQRPERGYPHQPAWAVAGDFYRLFFFDFE